MTHHRAQRIADELKERGYDVEVREDTGLAGSRSGNRRLPVEYTVVILDDVAVR